MKTPPNLNLSHSSSDGEQDIYTFQLLDFEATLFHKCNGKSLWWLRATSGVLLHQGCLVGDNSPINLYREALEGVKKYFQDILGILEGKGLTWSEPLEATEQAPRIFASVHSFHLGIMKNPEPEPVEPGWLKRKLFYYPSSYKLPENHSNYLGMLWVGHEKLCRLTKSDSKADLKDHLERALAGYCFRKVAALNLEIERIWTPDEAISAKTGTP